MTAIGVEPLTVEKVADTDPDARPVDESRDGPLARLARELALPAADLAKVLGIKGDTVQLYRASQLQPSDAAAALCLAYEKGLGKSGMPYQVFDAALESIHVKMKTPLSTFCFNMIRDGVIQKKPYEDGRSIVLTPAGEQKGEVALKALIAGGARSDAPPARGRRRAGGGRRPKRKRK
jgi:hypothetical protein